jgi:hypothetical protein
VEGLTRVDVSLGFESRGEGGQHTIVQPIAPEDGHLTIGPDDTVEERENDKEEG